VSRLRYIVVPVVVLLAIMVLSGLTFAQFEVKPPLAATSFVGAGFGARAIGMGGAFVAVADDATAVFWNPAGLAQLERPELSMVMATISALDMYGRRDWVPVGAEFQSTEKITDFSLKSESLGVDFLSVAFPKRVGETKTAWALSYSRDGFFKESGTIADPGVPGTILGPGTAARSLSNEFTSVSLAYARGNDNDMFGASLISQNSEFSSSVIDRPGLQSSASTENDRALGWQVGWLGKRKTTSFGATYRTSGGQDVSKVQRYPSSWSVGAAFQPREDLKWAVAYRRFDEETGNTILPQALNSYHVGVEQVLRSKGRLIPVRLGFYTRRSDAAGFEDVNVFTVGSGVAGPRWNLDGAVEFGNRSFRRYTVSLVSAF